MVPCPLYFFHEIAEIASERQVVFVRLQAVVEMLVVVRVLFEYERVANKQVRQSVCSNRSVYVDLIFILEKIKNSEFKKT